MNINDPLIRRTIHIVLLTSTLLGCITPLAAQTQLRVKINHWKQTDSVWVSVPQFWVKESQSRSTLKQVQDSVLVTTLPISQPRLVYLNFHSQWLKLYVEPRKDLMLTFEADSVAKTLHFMGQLASENALLHELGYTTYDMYPHAWRGGGVTPDEVATQLLTQKENQYAHLQQVQKTASFDSAFYNLLEGEIRYKPALELANLLSVGLGRATRSKSLEALKRVYGQESMSEDRFLISDIYFYTVSRTEMSLLALCGGDSICELEQIKQIYQVRDKAQFTDNNRQYGQLWDELDRAIHFLKGSTLEKILAMWIHAFKDDYGYLRPAYNQYKQRFATGSHRALVEQDLGPFLAFEKRTSTGRQIHFTPNSEQITNLSDLVRPHRGRVVYVDFWGTWCGPCRNEMSHSLTLQDKMSGQPVDFIFVANEIGSSGARVTIWQAVIKQLHLTGEHFLMTPTFLAGMKQQDLDVMQFPTYMLFDKSGKLVNTNAAPPSNLSAITAQLEEVLK